MKTYSKLEEKFDYDKEAATELAEAMTELVEVERRSAYLQEIVRRNAKLKKFMWGTEAGVVLALHDIPDDHFRNILTYLERNGRDVSPQMKAEARSRGIQIDGGVKGLAPLRAIAAKSTAFQVDEELDLDLDD